MVLVLARVVLSWGCPLFRLSCLAVYRILSFCLVVFLGLSRSYPCFCLYPFLWSCRLPFFCLYPFLCLVLSLPFVLSYPFLLSVSLLVSYLIPSCVLSYPFLCLFLSYLCLVLSLLLSVCIPSCVLSSPFFLSCLIPSFVCISSCSVSLLFVAARNEPHNCVGHRLRCSAMVL